MPRTLKTLFGNQSRPKRNNVCYVYCASCQKTLAEVKQRQFLENVHDPHGGYDLKEVGPIGTRAGFSNRVPTGNGSNKVGGRMERHATTILTWAKCEICANEDPAHDTEANIRVRFVCTACKCGKGPAITEETSIVCSGTSVEIRGHGEISSEASNIFQEGYAKCLQHGCILPFPMEPEIRGAANLEEPTRADASRRRALHDPTTSLDDVDREEPPPKMSRKTCLARK